MRLILLLFALLTHSIMQTGALYMHREMHAPKLTTLSLHGRTCVCPFLPAVVKVLRASPRRGFGCSPQHSGGATRGAPRQPVGWPWLRLHPPSRAHSGAVGSRLTPSPPSSSPTVILSPCKAAGAPTAVLQQPVKFVLLCYFSIIILRREKK